MHMPQGQRAFNVVLLRVSLCLPILKKNLTLHLQWIFFQFMDAYNILDSLKKRPIILSLFDTFCACVSKISGSTLYRHGSRNFSKKGEGLRKEKMEPS